MRVLHISDAHLGRAQYGLPEREQDYYQAFREALKLARSADAVLITGDLFDARRPPARAYMEALEALREAGMPAYAIGGNHDFSYLRYRADGAVHSPLKVLEAAGTLKLLCWREADLGGVRLFGACATPREYAEEFRSKLSAAPPGALLAIHQAIEGVKARYPTEEDDYTMPPQALQGVKAVHVAAGHIHDHYLRHPLGVLWAGSLEIWDATEFEAWTYAGRLEKVQDMAEKGAVLLDIAGGSASARPLRLQPRRPMYRVAVVAREPGELMRAVEEAARRLDRPGAVVRLELYGPSPQGKARDYRAAFQRALHVEVHDRTAPEGRPAALSGTAMQELLALLRQRLGPDADLVLRVLDLIREGDRGAALNALLQALHEA